MTDYGIMAMKQWVHERALLKAERWIMLSEIDVATTVIAHLIQQSDEAKAIFERDWRGSS